MKLLESAVSLLLAACLTGSIYGQGPRVLKLGHQFPATTGSDGDYRDRLARAYSAEVERRTKGAVKIEVLADNKYLKPDQYVDALKTGSADIILTPVNNLFNKMPELAVTILPGILKSYEHGAKWKTAPIGQEINGLFEKNGIAMLNWMWQAAGIVSLEKPIVNPTSLRGLRLRGGGKGVDSMFSAAGATVVNMPSSEIPKAFREGRIDAAVTAATSLNAYKLNDFCKAVTTPRKRSVFYFLAGIFASKAVLDSLTPEQRQILAETAVSLEPFALKSVRADEEAVAVAYLSGGAMVSDMDPEEWLQWQALGKAASWRDFERSVPNGKALLEKALAVPE